MFVPHLTSLSCIMTSQTNKQTSSNHHTITIGAFIDAMDSVNYVKVALEKPMGIVFEENEEKNGGGIYALELKEGGNAHSEGSIKSGDQLVGVNGMVVSGSTFDDALGAIVATETEVTELLFFRGPADQLYGKTGASEEWIQEFVSAGKA